MVANNINNTLNVQATKSQMKQIERLLYDFDVRPPQVSIQVTLLEFTETAAKQIGVQLNDLGTPNSGIIGGRNLRLGFSGASSTLFFNGRDPLRNLRLFEQMQIDLTNTISKGKVLANPTVLAVSGSTSNISVTNDVLASVNIALDPVTRNQVITPVIGQIGITLNITPIVTNDGTVNLNIAPTVRSIGGTASFTNPSTGASQSITLINSDTLTISQARVKNGETLIIGGLIRENLSSSVQKVPFLSDLPIVGAMFRAQSANSKGRSELVVLVTPKIVKEDGVPFFRNDWKQRTDYEHSYPETSDTQSQPHIPVASPLGDSVYSKLPAYNTTAPVGSKTDQQHLNSILQTQGSNSATQPKSALPLYSEVLK